MIGILGGMGTQAGLDFCNKLAMLNRGKIDQDSKIFKKGDFITFEPGSIHSSHTKDGCLILVFMRGINKPL